MDIKVLSRYYIEYTHLNLFKSFINMEYFYKYEKIYDGTKILFRNDINEPDQLIIKDDFEIFTSEDIAHGSVNYEDIFSLKKATMIQRINYIKELTDELSVFNTSTVSDICNSSTTSLFYMRDIELEQFELKNKIIKNSIEIEFEQYPMFNKLLRNGNNIIEIYQIPEELHAKLVLRENLGGC